MSEIMTEKDYLILLRSALAISAVPEALDTMTQLAGCYIEQGLTQEGADILAFVMRHDALHADSCELANELWEDLACYICPRVLVDAEDFGAKATFEDVVAYIFAGAG